MAGGCKRRPKVEAKKEIRTKAGFQRVGAKSKVRRRPLPMPVGRLFVCCREQNKSCKRLMGWWKSKTDEWAGELGIVLWFFYCLMVTIAMPRREYQARSLRGGALLWLWGVRFLPTSNLWKFPNKPCRQPAVHSAPPHQLPASWRCKPVKAAALHTLKPMGLLAAQVRFP